MHPDYGAHSSCRLFGGAPVNRSTIFVLLLLAAPSGKSFGRESQSVNSVPNPPASPAAPFAGCYELTLGGWWPWGFGEDTQFVTPPRSIRLLLERGTKGFEQSELLIRPLPLKAGSVSGRGGPSFWRTHARDRVDLIWTDGFTGVTLQLKGNGDNLRGWAHPHFDSPTLVPRIARVTARRIDCSASQERSKLETTDH